MSKVKVEIPKGSGVFVIDYFQLFANDGKMAFNPRMKIEPEVLNWADDNGIVIEDMLPLMQTTLCFDNEQDAILFKLRWL